MEAQIHVITLAVDDLDRALEFYRDGLGLETTGVVGTEFSGDDSSPAGAIAIFQLEGGLMLTLYPRTELSKDAHVPLGPPKTGEFSIGHLVASKDDVDALLSQAQVAPSWCRRTTSTRRWLSTVWRIPTRCPSIAVWRPCSRS